MRKKRQEVAQGKMEGLDDEPEKTPDWIASDERLLRAARKIIRLYDMEHAGLIAVKAESVAAIIAHELNGGKELASF